MHVTSALSRFSDLTWAHLSGLRDELPIGLPE